MGYREFFLVALVLAGCGAQSDYQTSGDAVFDAFEPFTETVLIETEFGADDVEVTAPNHPDLVRPLRLSCDGDYCGDLERAASHWMDLIDLPIFSDDAEATVSFFVDGEINNCAQANSYAETGCVILLNPEQCAATLPIYLVAGHELGHCLGLGHSLDPDSIMNRTYNKRTDITKANADFIFENWGENENL